METLLDKLSRLSTQRTVRTDRLSDLTRELAGKIEEVMEVGEEASAGGVNLRVIRVRSNVGESRFLVDSDTGAAYERRPGHEGFCNGDFNAPLPIGAGREDMLRFAAAAPALVAALADKFAAECDTLDASAAVVERAIEQVAGLTA